MSDAVTPEGSSSALGYPGRRSLMWANLSVVQNADWLKDEHLGRTLIFAPLPAAAGEPLVTFGWYAGQPLSALLANSGYVEWLATSHKWNPRKHPEVYEAVLLARREPPPPRGLGELLYSANTLREASAHPVTDASGRRLEHCRLLVLDMDDDPTKLYLYIKSHEPIVYYVQHGGTGLIKIGTTREQVDTRAMFMPFDQGLDGTWKPLAVELGSYDLEKQRHREFGDLRPAFKPDGRRNRELFHPGEHLMKHIGQLLQSCRSWEQPEPHTNHYTACPFERTVLDAELPA